MTTTVLRTDETTLFQNAGSNMIIGTHNSTFHADDVFAVAMLLKVYPQAKVIRSRDTRVLDQANILVDVGAEYDPKRGRFDHHQRGGAGLRANNVPYASAGLVWREFSRQLISAVVAENSSLDLDALAQRIDHLYVQGIDATDTGSIMTTSHLKDDESLVIPVTNLSGTIGLLNPIVGEQDCSNEAQDRAFMQAVTLAGELLTQVILRAASTQKWTKYVQEADKGEAVIVLDEPSADVACPWTTEVCAREHILFVVFPTPDRSGWRIKGAPVSPASFDSKKLLPESWAGLRDKELDTATGAEGCVFYHPGRWIAGAKTREAILRMASLALK